MSGSHVYCFRKLIFNVSQFLFLEFPALNLGMDHFVNLSFCIAAVRGGLGGLTEEPESPSGHIYRAKK